MSAMDLKTIALVGGAVALPSLLDLGKHAGAASSAASGALAGSSVAGFTFAASARLADAWAAMNRALSTKQLTNGELHQVCDAWLAAFRAGAAADPINFALITEAADFGDLTGGRVAFADPSTACIDKYTAFRSELGRALCALRSTRDTLSSGGWSQRFATQEDVLAQTRALALAMDNADYRRDGDRRSDRRPAGLGDLPGYVGGLAIGAIKGALGSPTLLFLGVAGVVAWRVLR